MDDDRPDFLSERGENTLLEAANGREVSLTRLFEHYEVRSLEASEVADLVGVEESDVRKGISYWRKNSEVYTELENSIQNFSSRDVINNAAEHFQRVEPEEYSSGSKSSSSKAERPLEAAEKALSELIERTGTGLAPENLEEDPNEKYLALGTEEIHMEWERNGRDLAVYAGWNENIGPETAFTDFSVDGEQGKTLYVDTDEVEGAVKEMYRNAVFGSK